MEEIYEKRKTTLYQTTEHQIQSRKTSLLGISARDTNFDKMLINEKETDEQASLIMFLTETMLLLSVQV